MYPSVLDSSSNSFPDLFIETVPHLLREGHDNTRWLMLCEAQEHMRFDTPNNDAAAAKMEIFHQAFFF